MNDGNYNLSVKCSHPSKDTLHTHARDLLLFAFEVLICRLQ